VDAEAVMAALEENGFHATGGVGGGCCGSSWVDHLGACVQLHGLHALSCSHRAPACFRL
jgi:hypothetical protein